MTFSIKQLLLVVSIITVVISNNTYCAEQCYISSDSTSEQSPFYSDTSLSEHGKNLSDNNIDTIYNTKYRVYNNKYRTYKEDNNINNLEYYKNIYQTLLSDISKFKNDIKIHGNNQYNNKMKQIFFDALHDIKNSLQQLEFSCSDINEQNKIRTYINNNLKSRDIYLVLA